MVIRKYYPVNQKFMKYLYLIIVFITFSQNSLLSQNDIDLYSNGMNHFNHEEYSAAIAIFNKIILRDEIDKELLASASLYVGESLLGLNQVNGAISKF